MASRRSRERDNARPWSETLIPFPLSRITRWKMQRPSVTVPLNLGLHNTDRPTAGKGE